MNKLKQLLKDDDSYGIYCVIAYAFLVFVLIFGGGGLVISACQNGVTLDFHSSHINILECYGGADVGSYIRYFLSLDQHGLVDTIRKYHFGSWPPGFAYLELTMYYIFGDHIIIPLAVFVGMLWTLLMCQIRWFLFRVVKLNIYIATFLPLLVLCFSFVNSFLLKDGLLMSESVATPFFGIFILNFCALVYKIKHTRTICVPYILAVSTLAGGLSFMRAQYDLVIVCLVAFLFLILIIFKRVFRPEVRTKFLKSLALFVFCYACLTIPYKVFMVASGKPFAMASVAPPYWASELSIRATSYAGFIADGGGHVMCEINPSQCDLFDSRKANGDSPGAAEYLKAAVLTALSSPINLIVYKGPYLVENSLYDNMRDSRVLYSNSILYVIFILVFFYYWIKRGLSAFLVIGCMLSVAAGSLGYGFLDHFEPRYFIPVKLFAILAIIFMFSDGLQAGLKKNEKD